MALRVRTHIRTGQGSAAQTPPSPPSNTVAPAVTGTTTLGQTLSCSTGTWTNSPSLFTYQWIWADTNAPISGANSATYVLQAGDVGHTIKCAVTASNAGGSATANSNTTAAVTAGGVSPDFQTAFTSISSLPTGVSLSRASNAMVTDSAGKLTYAPNNLLTQSNNFSDAAWTKDTTGSITATGISDPIGGTAASTFTAGASGGRLYQNAAGTLANTTNGLSTVWLRRRTGTGQVSMFNASAAPISITISGTWAQYTLVVASGPNGYAGIQLATSGDAVDIYAPTLSCVTYETSPRSGDQVITAGSAYYGPRFDHAWNGSAWVAVGLLIEEQRTNLVKSSGAIGDANWTPGGGGMSASLNSAASPDGGTNASSLTLNLSHFYQQLAPSTGSVAASVWLRVPSGTGTIYLGLVGTSTTVYTTCNLTTTWQRFTVVNSACGNPSYLSIGDDGVHAPTDCQAWGAQAEDLSSFPTSYIPTTSVAVTRSADIVQLTGFSTLGGVGDSGSLIVEVGELPYPGTLLAEDVVVVGNPSHCFVFRDHTSDRAGPYSIRSSSAALTALTAALTTWAGQTRVALAWDVSGDAVSSNGATTISRATDGLSFVGSIYLGSDGVGEFMNGHLRSIAIYSSRLSDTDLQAKSVVGAAF